MYETTHFDNIRTMVENVAEKYPGRNAFTYRRNPHGDVLHMTYRESEEFVRDLATALAARGAEKQTVAILGESSVEWIHSYFSAMTIGAVTVPIDKDLPVSDIISIMNTAECKFVFYSASIQDKMDEILNSVPSIETKVILNWDYEGEDLSVNSLRNEGNALFEGGNRQYSEYQIDNEAVASIVFTSGTTGKGKGVMLSQKNICSDMEQGMYNFQITYRSMLLIPLHHTFGSTVNLIGHYSQGCELYISSGLKYLLKELQEYRPTHLILVPLFVDTFYKKIINTAEKKGKLQQLYKLIDLSNGLRKVGIDVRKFLFKSVTAAFGGEVEMIICGGANLNQSIIDFFDGIGIVILNGYGITECAPLISCNRNCYRHDGSVGMPIVGGEVKIIDPDENGEGEIAYRGPNVMLGYYKNKEATDAAIDSDGFFHTGDYGKIVRYGDDPWIYITGRLKNLIIFSNGKNVYPEELETDVQGIYGVSEVVVYAGESRTSPQKEVIVAEIFPDYEALQLRGITDVAKYFNGEIKKINQKNVSYKSIGLVKIRENEFPKNTSKKITRYNLDKSID